MGVWSVGLLTASVTVLLVSMATYSSACNEAVCASLVSKCMLLKSCECNMLDKDNCTCCRDCHKCLAKLYIECCSCVGMCPETNPKSNVYKTSTVEELPEPIAALFSVLTEEEDPLLRWSTYTYPAHLDLLYFKPRGHSLSLDPTSVFGSPDGKIHHQINMNPTADTTNCTVAYMAQCMSLTKCRDSCQSMGAARYRWFHEYGCCECIGSTCLNFGKGEPLCLKCPVKDGEEEEEEEEMEGLGVHVHEENQEEKEQELEKKLRVDTLGGANGMDAVKSLPGKSATLRGGDSLGGENLGLDSVDPLEEIALDSLGTGNLGKKYPRSIGAGNLGKK